MLALGYNEYGEQNIISYVRDSFIFGFTYDII